MENSRVVCLNCIDGRVQIPVIEWIQKNYNADYVDMITEPGMDGLVSDDNKSIEGIKEKIKISIAKNNASVIFVVGHYDCQGNSVSDQEHKIQVGKSAERLGKEFSDIMIVGLWVNDAWQVEKV